MTMQLHHLADAAGIPYAPFVGWCGYQVTHAIQSDPAPPWFVGIVMLVITGLLIPGMKWLQARSDGRRRQSEKLAERREKRDDDRQEAFAHLVETMGVIGRQLEHLNTRHGDLQKQLESLPGRIVKQCNGGGADQPKT